MDIQAIITYAIVACAALYVARRIYDQLAALRKPTGKNGASPCDTCGGCVPGSVDRQPLIGLSAAPPRRVREPKDGT